MADSNMSLVSKLVVGIGALVITSILVFVIVGTVHDSHLLRETAITSSGQEIGVDLSGTPHTLATFDGYNRSISITSYINGTAGGYELITAANFTYNTATGTVTNATAVEWEDVDINVTYISPTSFEETEDKLIGNLTAGVDNVSAKIPTILLIAAVVLLFGVLLFLIAQSQRMGINNGGSL